MSSRTCGNCGSSLREGIKTSYCGRFPDCKRLADNERARQRYKPRIRQQSSRDSGWVIPDDDYVDPIAVYLTTNGIRSVRLTRQERIACIPKMIDNDMGFAEMRHFLKMGDPQLRQMLGDLGWEVKRDTHIRGAKVMTFARKSLT